MKTILVLSIFLSFNLVGQTFNFGTQQHWGTTGDDPISKIIKTSDGGYIAVGFVENSNNTHTGPVYGLGDYWVIKLDNLYNVVWEKAIGGSDYDYAYDIIEYSTDKFLISGESQSPISGNKTAIKHGSSDIWVIAIDMSGVILWQNSYGSVDGYEGSNFNSILKIGANEILLTCNSNGSISGTKTIASFGSSDYYLISIDTLGNQLGDHSFGGSTYESLPNLFLTNSNQILIVGSSNSGISGNKTTINYGSTDTWIVKLNSNKQIISQFSYGGSLTDQMSGFLELNNNYVFAGSSNSVASGNKTSGKIGTTDAIILKIDTFFNILSDNNYGHSGAYSFFDQIELNNNELIFIGAGGGGTSMYKTNPSLGNTDMWALAFDTNSNYKWNFSFGGNFTETTVVGGLFINNDYTFDLFFNSSSAGFSGDLTTGNYGQQDLFHVKISSDLGLEEKEQTINVYPNPFTSSLSIIGDYKSLEIYDYLGKLMFQSEHKFNIDLNFLPTGYYVINFIDNQGRTSHKKLVKN